MSIGEKVARASLIFWIGTPVLLLGAWLVGKLLPFVFMLLPVAILVGLYFCIQDAARWLWKQYNSIREKLNGNVSEI